tara:strand:+ start:122 stop:535 length:414 start_codon:yes stop_codon:yes gene_type:complete
MATIKKGLKKAQDGYSASEDSTSKLKSADGNYKTKFEWKKGESKPSQITERRTLKGLLTGAKKAQGKLDMSKMKNGGSLTGLKASNKRVGPVDPNGAFTKVQERTLAGAKGKAKLVKDKQLGATKMTAKAGKKISKK